MTNLNRVVISGLGVVSSIGIGLQEFWNALEAGKSGIKNITSFDVSGSRCQVGGVIEDFEPTNYIDPKEADRMDRYAHLGVAAGKMAFQDSRLSERELEENPGVYMGSGLGGMMCYEKNFELLHENGPRGVHPNAVANSMPNSVSANMAISMKLRGPNITISTACTSSLHSIGHAFEMIRHGRAKMILAGGAEAPLMPLTFAAFDAMRVMSSRNNSNPAAACRPFDLNRDGMVLGDGAAILVLEEWNHAKTRKVPLYGEILGYGSNCGAYHHVAPDPSAKDIIEVMRHALEDAKLDVSDVDYVNAHATATQLNDRAEGAAIRTVFKNSLGKLALSCTKSMIGHTVGAAGAFGVLASLLPLCKGIIPPTINFSTVDPDCALDVTPNTARKMATQVAMVNAFGFGSNNACLILRRL